MATRTARTRVIEDREWMRRWLIHRYDTQGFRVDRLARALRISHGAIGHWLRGLNSVHPRYWDGIAKFFGYSEPEQILAEARTRTGASVAAR